MEREADQTVHNPGPTNRQRTSVIETRDIRANDPIDIAHTDHQQVTVAARLPGDDIANQAFCHNCTPPTRYRRRIKERARRRTT
ncbi:hypothetical protein [Streptosporangium vulgare]|uniref:hypothetical protein n=1 Tax=Streptosporangium vulgare TaxID=46190 RepID=UPI0031D05A72